MQKTQGKEIIGLGVVVCLVVGGAVLVRLRTGDLSSQSASVDSALSLGASNENIIEVEPFPVAKETISSSVSENLKTYTHPSSKFSVDFPVDMSVEVYDEGGESETIVFKGNEGSFQVFVSPYDGDDSLTVEDIKRLQPFTQVVEPQIIQIRGVPAVLFLSAVPEIGKTREVWLAHRKRLFSVTAHADHDAWLSHIMTTWRFE